MKKQSSIFVILLTLVVFACCTPCDAQPFNDPTPGMELAMLDNENVAPIVFVEEVSKQQIEEIIQQYFTQDELKMYVREKKLLKWEELLNRADDSEDRLIQIYATQVKDVVSSPDTCGNIEGCPGGTCCGWYDYPYICYYCFLGSPGGMWLCTRCVNLAEEEPD